MNATAIQINSIIHRTKEIEFTKLDDELLSIDEQAGYCYSMNGSGEKIWEMISNPISVNNICQKLSGEFNVSLEICSKDVLNFLQKLHEADLVEVKDASRS